MMKKIWKSTFALLMALTLLVSLAACGGSPAAAPSGDAAPQAAAPADDGKKPLTCLITEVPKGAPFTDPDLARL